MNKNQLSDRFNGRNLDRPFVLDVVTVCTKGLAPHERQRLLATAERLWDRPPPDVDPRLPVSAANTVLAATVRVARAEAGRAEALQEVLDKQRQIDQAVQAQALAEQALQAASALSAVLAVWVVTLADEVQHRRFERDAVAGRTPTDRDELVRVEALLSLTIRQHERVLSDQDKAVGDFGHASQVLAGLIITARRLHEEIARLRGDEPPGPHAPNPAADATALVPFDATAEFTANIDQAISRVEALSRTIGQQVRQAEGILAALDPQAPDDTLRPDVTGGRPEGYRPGSFLALLTPDDHDALLRIGEPHRTQELDGLSHRRGVVLVRSGTLLRKIRTSAGSFNVGVCGAGDVLGDGYAITGRLSSEYMAYWTNGDTVVVSPEQFTQYLNARPSAAQALLAASAYTSAQQSKRAGKGPRATLIRVLVRLAEAHSITLNGPITLAISASTLNELVPQGREALDALAHEGLVHTEEEQVIIPDLSTLRLKQLPADEEPPDAESESAHTTPQSQ